MKVSTLIGGPICAVLCVALCGCMVTYTSVKDTPRVAVTFQSAEGAKTFYEAYLYRYYSQPYGRKISIGIPLPYLHSEVKTDNVYFDDAVRAADTNHDGIISDQEARAYSAWAGPQTPRVIPVLVAKR